jgi:hypothetical protein
MQRAFRDHLQAAALAWTGLGRAFDRIRPDLLVTVNGHRSTTRVALETARSRGIRALCHERGQRRETMTLFENDHCMAAEVYRQLWERWGGVPLSEAEIRRADAYIADRSRGADLNWRAFSPPPAGVAKLHQELGLDPARPVWSLFTSTSDELVGLEGFDDTVAAQQHWLLAALAFARDHPAIQLVVRTHPNSAAIRQDAEFIGYASRLLPENGRIVPADRPVSSYDLAAASTVGLVFNSTLAIEMAAHGIRVLFSGDGRYGGLPFLSTANSLDLFNRHAQVALGTPLLAREPAIARLAHRFVYAWIFRWLFPFPLVEMGEVHEGRARYTRLEELAPGKDATLDRLREIVFAGASVIPSPSAAERARSDVDERRWFRLDAPIPRAG